MKLGQKLCLLALASGCGDTIIVNPTPDASVTDAPTESPEERLARRFNAAALGLCDWYGGCGNSYEQECRDDLSAKSAADVSGDAFDCYDASADYYACIVTAPCGTEDAGDFCPSEAARVARECDM